MTLDVILGKGVASLWGWSMGASSEGPLVHPGLRMAWTSCCTCQPNIMPLGCRLIACMVVVPAPVVRLPDSHVYALWP